MNSNNTLNTEQESFKNTLIDCLRKNICFITYPTDDEKPVSEKPYTLCLETKFSDFSSIDVSSDSRLITAWDILDNSFIKLDLTKITGYHYESDPMSTDLMTEADNHVGTITQFNIDDADSLHAHSLSRGLQIVDEIENDIHNCCNYKGEELTREELLAYRMNYKISRDPKIWAILKVIGFAVTDPDKLHTVDDKDMDNVRDGYMNQIRMARVEAFKELDQLEAEARGQGSTDDDIADIDTIKQMFRDIPQDNDLTKYKDIPSLVSFWPSLLLPQPACLDDGHIDFLTNRSVEYDNPMDDYLSLLSDITDIDELEKLYKELTDTSIPVPHPEELLEGLAFRIEELKEA